MLLPPFPFGKGAVVEEAIDESVSVEPVELLVQSDESSQYWPSI